MKRKLLPPVFMLSAGAVASIMMYVMHYEIFEMLRILLFVLLIFYLIGFIAKKVLDSFYAKREKVSDEGEVIEKEAAESDEIQKEQEDSEERF